ncbi:MAG: YerC/YecD family TrpR-related protein [Patescibacteria group bacterium]|nr:YerC/YecD family TrpR-related protein [Patescibacteria group bacterium]
MIRVKTKLPENPNPEYPWVNKEMEQWFKDMESLEGYEEILKYFSDLLTDNELRMLAQRWHIARELISTEDSNIEIAERVEASPSTVGTVAKRVYYGMGGLLGLLGKVLASAEEKKRLKEIKKAMKKKKRDGSYSYAKGYFR